MGAVAEMRRQGCSRIHSGPNLLGTGLGMPDRHNDSFAHHGLDRGRRFGPLGGYSDQFDVPVRGFLPTVELVQIRRPDAKAYHGGYDAEGYAAPAGRSELSSPLSCMTLSAFL